MKLYQGKNYNQDEYRIWLPASKVADAQKNKRDENGGAKKHSVLLGEVGNRGAATGWVCCCRYENIVWFYAHK